MSISKVAIIFDNQLRPDTTGVYFRRALGQLGLECEHFLPTDIGRIPEGRFDLVLAIDDDLDYPLPRHAGPLAWYAIDTHRHIEPRLARARVADFSFTAQRDGAEEFRRRGVAWVHWLPLGCDPEIHRRHNLSMQHDLCFVGHMFAGPRQELVKLLKQNFPNMFVGQRFMDDMARMYSQSRIVFNRSILNDVNMRVWEALSVGRLLVTNDLSDNGQAEYLRDGLHLATYRDAGELLDKVRFYLKHDKLREGIAATGQEEVLAKHTYRHRVETMLRVIEKALSTTTVPTGVLPTAATASAPSQAPERAKTSIVIVTHNQLDYTKLCVESIERCQEYRDIPLEVIVVDNGSTDETVAYLQSLKSAQVILNPENRYFPKAANQGMRLATGKQVLLLNNDTIVTQGWLRRMLEALESEPSIGLVGPVSNNISGEQQVPTCYGHDLTQLETFAADWAKRHTGVMVNTDRLVGFCLLVRREVIEKIGYLDERFGKGNFEDDDYCRRARNAGFRAVIAMEAFVHHFGGVTFKATNIDYGALLSENQRLYEEKWAGISELSTATKSSPPQSIEPQTMCLPEAASTNDETQRTPPLYPEKMPEGGIKLEAASDGHGLLLHLPKVQVSCCIIGKNNAKTIRPCITSVLRHVDEVIFVDTGSTDGTDQIARELGARVFYFPWCDDFAAARNESIRHARGKWIFWMDTDDVLPEECAKLPRQLAQTKDKRIWGYIGHVHCPGAGEDGMNDVTVVQHVKMFRNYAAIYWERRLHEQVLMAIRRAGGDVLMTGLYVVHAGYDHTPEGQKHKCERDFRLLHLELQDRRDDPFTLFNLGMTHADVGEPEKAVDYLRRCIENSEPGESHMPKVHSLLAYCFHQLDRPEQAYKACQRGLALASDDLELRFRKGVLLHALGRLEEAAKVYLDILSGRNNGWRQRLTSVDHGLASFKTRQNLAAVYSDMGRWDKAEEQWRHITKEKPDYRPGWRGLGETVLKQQKIEALYKLACQIVEQPRLRGIGLYLRGRVLLAQNNWAGAMGDLTAALDELPADLVILNECCRLFFEHGSPEASEPVLRRLVQNCPQDPHAHQNLATVLNRAGKHEDAVHACRESLRLRPAALVTQLTLGYALEGCGRLAEARTAWQAVLRLEPYNAEASRRLSALATQQDHASGTPSPAAGGTSQRQIEPAPDSAVNGAATANPEAVFFRKTTLPTENGGADFMFAARGPVDESIVRDVCERDIYRLVDVKTPPQTILDIGAHIGCFSALAAHRWPKARIVACEPDLANYVLLDHHLKPYLARRQIEVVNKAVLGENVAETDFWVVADKAQRNSGGGSCCRQEQGASKARLKAIPIAQLWRDYGLTSCDLLKLDCEGSEYSILEGLRQAELLPRVGRIVGEWHCGFGRFERPEDAEAELRRLVGPTHKLEIEKRQGSREGHFVAERL